MKRLVIFVSLVLAITADSDNFHPHKKISSQSRTKKGQDFYVLNEMEKESEFWREKAQNKLREVLNRKTNENTAKNVILFLGDGMGISTVATTRMYLGAEQNHLSFEKFPFYGLSKTYCVDKQVPDSACTATAYLSGVKTNYRSIGVTANVTSTGCNISDDDRVYSFAKWAQDAGKSTGFVTTTRVTHASPAGLYAQIPHRDWESNGEIPASCSVRNFEDIAHQLVHNEVSKKFNVVLGGGRRKFLSTEDTDDEGVKGQRTDGKNLIEEWTYGKPGRAQYIWNNQQLNEVDIDKTDYLLGLFESDHCKYQLDIKNQNLEHQEPSLTDMTIAAIKMLQKNKDKGFFLFVEGGRIDMAHHDTRARKAMEETKEFARAIDMATKMTDERETLIVVTSDHSHGFTYNGYPNRGSDVLGNPEVSDFDEFNDGGVFDDLTYTSVSYANGPGYSTAYDISGKVRRDLSRIDLKNPNLAYPASVPLARYVNSQFYFVISVFIFLNYSETHSGEDVGVYAKGPWAKIFTGNYEQTSIPMLMAYASKVGPYSSASQHFISLVLIFVAVIVSRYV